MATPTLSYTVKVPGSATRFLAEAAAKRGMKPSQFVQLCYDAGYAARVGFERGHPATDAELDMQVRLVMCLAGQADHAAIATATGVPASLVAKILQSFRLVREPLDGNPLPAEPPSRPDPTRPDPTRPDPTARVWTAERVESVRRLWADGKTEAEIASAVGTSKGTLHQFVLRRRDVCPKRKVAP